MSYLNIPPLYERVKAMIKTKIHSGAWPANYRVPSESELVTLFGYSRMTINRALRELTAEGLLVRMQGSVLCRRNSRPVGAAGH